MLVVGKDIDQQEFFSGFFKSVSSGMLRLNMHQVYSIGHWTINLQQNSKNSIYVDTYSLANNPHTKKGVFDVAQSYLLLVIVILLQYARILWIFFQSKRGAFFHSMQYVNSYTPTYPDNIIKKNKSL